MLYESFGFAVTDRDEDEVIMEKNLAMLAMFRYCFNAVDNKSGNGMLKATVGLTLSYSF